MRPDGRGNLSGRFFSQKGRGVMQEFRLFFFDGACHIEKAHEFEAENDEAAIKISEGWREGRRAELWHRDRRVMVWD